MKRLLLLLATLLVATTHARQTEAPAAADTTRTTTREKILSHLPDISGYLQLKYDWANDGTSTFLVKRVRVTLAGDILPTLDYRIQVELAKPQIVDA